MTNLAAQIQAGEQAITKELEKVGLVFNSSAEKCEVCGSDCNERDELIKAEREIDRLKAAIAKAYGYLWCVNCEPGTQRQYSPERAVYAARKELRDLLTKEQRGAAINAAVQEVHETVRAESILRA